MFSVISREWLIDMSSGIDFLAQPIFLYSLPTIIALTTKLLIFWLGRYSLCAANYPLWLCLILLFGMNIFELTAFLYVHKNHGTLFVLSGYYACAISSRIALLWLALRIGSYSNTIWKTVIIGFTIICALTLFIPNAGLAGAQSISYSITRIAGPYYWILQVGLTLPLTMCFCMLAYCAIRHRNDGARRRALVLAIGIAPMFIAVISVAILMQCGIPMNASIIIAVAVNLLMAVLLYTENKEGLFRFLSFVPYTEERRFINRLRNLTIRETLPSLYEFRSSAEQALAQRALNNCQGNKSAAARLLKISRPTFLRKLKGVADNEDNNSNQGNCQLKCPTTE